MRLQTLSAARWILAFFALLAVAAVFLSVWLSLLFVLLFFFTVAFFRDPERAVPADPNLIVAAADGTVMDIVETDESQVLQTRPAVSESFCRFSMCIRIVRRSMAGSFTASIREDFVSMRAARTVPRRTNR